MLENHSFKRDKPSTNEKGSEFNKTEGKGSIFRFIWGYMKFDSKDPLWYKLAVILIIVSAFTIISLSIREWPGLISNFFKK